ncbi:3-keto-5-aminohexanoate cleavage protein [Sphingomonas sp. 28-63-12]|uniref:3-keto-5-aminohexanoate cleavage protein n=1 Tax=Sphingomonas sp. 28-63-12 TaxID=1970434 RepID=UPI000BCC0EBB|nr:MAG: 3-keto-5-aminohexanoate cleavage protein [Sphingomonas sp. 28-63-12]
MRQSDKVIITCAVTGGVHTPTMSPHLPITPDQIADQSIAAAEAGAAILHLHARDPATGKPSQNPDTFMAFLPRIKQSTDAVINVTTGGGLGMPLEDRLAPAHRTQPELVSLNMGTMNFGIFHLANRYTEWQHDWEQPYLAQTDDLIYPNTFRMIDRIISEVGDAYGTRFEFECYDVGHLYTLAHFVREGRLKPPYFIQFILGVMGGIGADPDHLTHLRQTADKLFGDDYLMSCIAVGKHQMPMLTMSAVMGGNVRVGLEDSLYIDRGRLAVSNAEQVTRIREIIERLGMSIATPAEARAMLDLKGGDAVGF